MTGRAAGTFAIHTLGCKVNRYESDAVAQGFAAAGYEQRGFGEISDIYIINTCTVTGEAGRKSGQFIRRARMTNPGAVIVAMGCHTELFGGAEEADIVIGTRNKSDAVRLVGEFLSGGAIAPRTVRIAADAGCGFEETGPALSREASRAFLKIEDGCNNFCSYCIIPYARGRVRSRGEEAILEEARGLADAGYREIVLTGIHICSYGADRGSGSEALADLTADLSAIGGIDRIRFGSLEPDSITPRFLERIASLDKLCPHFHLSLQSGSDSVLRRMDRRYDTAGYRTAAAGLRARFPEAGLTTDIITGFPGETDAEHRETMDFCAEMAFQDIHVFRFSRREGTKAAGMPGAVPAAVMNRRSAELIDLAAGLRRARFAAMAGKTRKVLIEAAGGEASGYTEDYLPARIHLPPECAEDPSLKGTIRGVFINGHTEKAILADLLL